MVEISLKSDPRRNIWYSSEETHEFLRAANQHRKFIHSHSWRPPTDVYENEDTITVRVEVAGMKEEDFSISLTGRFLTIRGTRSDVVERRAFHQMEIFFGEFSSEVELPSPVLAEATKAEYKMGFLRIVLPKKKPQRIQIQE